MVPPKVFISYSRDSPEHEAKVLAFANRLRGNGIDAVLDQYESFPSQGWILWMKQQLRDAQYVLLICTETYRRRAEGEEATGVGLGATYESQLIAQHLYDAGGVNERFVPVLLGESDRQHILMELRRYTHFPVYTEEGYEGLYRLLTNQPKIQKPILGQALLVREAKPDFRHLVLNAQDYREARQGVEKAAVAGIGQAMNNLGWLYQSGYGVKQDYQQARQWYEKAARQSDRD